LQIEEAAKQANAHDFIMSFEVGNMACSYSADKFAALVASQGFI